MPFCRKRRIIMSRHKLNSRITGVKCIKCGSSYPVGDYFFGCPECLSKGENSAVTLIYEGKGKIDESERGFKRYKEFLPYDDAVTLGEGGTPVLRLSAIEKDLDLRAVYTKNEFQNPTGSHKDRMNPFITARASELGYSVVTCASSGNEAASLAAYAAAEGLSCVNVSTKTIPELWKKASDATGAELVLVEKSPDRLSYQRDNYMDKGWYPATNLLDVPTSSSCYGIQGYKTLSYEIYEYFRSEIPDYIFIPTCRGDLLYGVYEGFCDLKEAGLIKELPHLVACEPNARLERILSGEKKHIDTFDGDTSATSSIGGKTATWQSEKALRETKGFAISVSQEEALESVGIMGRLGLYLETSSSIVYPCLKKAVEEGRLPQNSCVMLVLTSNGYKNR